MEHIELLQEMTLLEKLSAQERLKHAKRRRQQQLTNWVRREGGFTNSVTTINGTNSSSSKRSKQFSVQFPQNIVLLEATARQDIDEVRNLLKSGKYNPNTTNEDGLTPIHQCSIDDSREVLNLLIQHGGDVNAKDRDLWTPLHAAATCGHLEVCKILIENGAELLALNADGNMPYDICDDDQTLDYIEIEMDRNDITQEMIDKTRTHVENQMLIDLQSSVKKFSSTRSIDEILSYRNDEGATPLHIACANGYLSVVQYLLQQHVSINIQDPDGWAPIHAATFWCQQPIIGQLIDAGADIYETIPDGRSALDLCDDPDLRTNMIEFYELTKRNKEKAAAEAAAAAAKLKQNTNLNNLVNNRIPMTLSSLQNVGTPRTGTLYESRSSLSSPYGSGSTLNRSSSIRRASLRDSDKAKKLNENFLDVLQAKDKIQEDGEEISMNNSNTNDVKIYQNSNNKDDGTSSVTTDSTIRESISMKNSTTIPPVELPLPPLKGPPPLPPGQTNADTLSDIKRRREERRRGIGIPSIANNTSAQLSIPPVISPPLPTIDFIQQTNTKMLNGNHLKTLNQPVENYSTDKYIQISDFRPNDNRQKRICCTIL